MAQELPFETEQNLRMLHHNGQRALHNDIHGTPPTPWQNLKSWHAEFVRDDAQAKAYLAITDYKFASEVARLTQDSHLGDLAKTIFLREVSTRKAPIQHKIPPPVQPTLLDLLGSPKIDTYQYFTNPSAPGRLFHSAYNDQEHLYD